MVRSKGGHNFKDLTGQIFGNLAVIRRGHNKHGRASWICRCICGKIKEICGSTLRNGSSTSCGCKCGGHNKIDLTGKQFGHLIVVREFGDCKWECLCECGNICIVTSNHLNANRRKSCGCTNFRIRGLINPKWTGYKEISGSYWHRIIQGAKSRGLPIEITIKDAWDVFIRQNCKCALSGAELKFSGSSLKDQTASLDRIDSNRGYFLDNIQWVHKEINKVKLNTGNQRFIEICRSVSEYQKN